MCFPRKETPETQPAEGQISVSRTSATTSLFYSLSPVLARGLETGLEPELDLKLVGVTQMFPCWFRRFWVMHHQTLSPPAPGMYCTGW